MSQLALLNRHICGFKFTKIILPPFLAAAEYWFGKLSYINRRSSHQRSQIQRCRAHQWSTGGAAWCPGTGWFSPPSTGTSSRTLPLTVHQQHSTPNGKIKTFKGLVLCTECTLREIINDPYLLDILSLGDPLISYFDSWVTETFNEVSRVQAHQISYFVSIWWGKWHVHILRSSLLLHVFNIVLGFFLIQLLPSWHFFLQIHL